MVWTCIGGGLVCEWQCNQLHCTCGCACGGGHTLSVVRVLLSLLEPRNKGRDGLAQLGSVRAGRRGLGVRRLLLGDVPLSAEECTQRIGRAVRFMGHASLPEAERVVAASIDFVKDSMSQSKAMSSKRARSSSLLHNTIG